MDLDNIPEEVWQSLASHTVCAAAEGVNVDREVRNYFYRHIYRRWAKDFAYAENLAGQPDAGWAKVAELWGQAKDQGASLGQLLGDDSVGIPVIQVAANDPTHKQTRLGERYSRGPSPSRFQFLVHSGGGMVLLNRMRVACQKYIKDNRSTVVDWWKVFGESFAQQGQSDACVVYLLLMYTDPQVTHFIDNYLWKNIHDIVNERFVPIGLTKVNNKPLWATFMPSKAKWSQVFGPDNVEGHYGSAGGLMGFTLGKAFSQALGANPEISSFPDALVRPAKEKAAGVLQELLAD
jgi:hypothetical protein